MNLADFLSHYPAETLAALGFFAVASVKFVDSLFKKDWEACAKIIVAGLAPAVLAHFIGFSVVIAALAGLSGSGLITTVDRVGSKA